MGRQLTGGHERGEVRLGSGCMVFRPLFSATSAEISSSDPSELRVAIGPQAVTIKGKPHFPSSSIFLWRTVFRDTVRARAVASWLAPSATGVGARAEAPRGPTSRGQAHSLDVQRYDSQKPLKQSPMVKKDVTRLTSASAAWTTRPSIRWTIAPTRLRASR